eukprot:CAMPEP_0117644072 /NCGR_PEP_ID=MMETSP0802-20121206/10785_1 /TAXON_ID=38833 /ORGANISM="Micromonas sp., Strain CCMP2099" /LENGTH=42 /DNA_ID= /DNA_START= /DNA_END= /DNA_ORIENTATION=
MRKHADNTLSRRSNTRAEVGRDDSGTTVVSKPGVSVSSASGT